VGGDSHFPRAGIKKKSSGGPCITAGGSPALVGGAAVGVAFQNALGDLRVAARGPVANEDAAIIGAVCVFVDGDAGGEENVEVGAVVGDVGPGVVAVGGGSDAEGVNAGQGQEAIVIGAVPLEGVEAGVCSRNSARGGKGF